MAKENEAYVAYNASAWGSITITPSDATILSPNLRGLYVGVGGTVVVTMMDGSTATFVGVPAGTLLPIQCYQVKASGTTATTMVGLF